MSFPDYFAFFDLPRNLLIDLGDIEKRFYALSRQLHPDRFVRKSLEERQYSLDATAYLNDAYRTLRDPIARAMYLLKLEGFDIGEQGTKDVPPEMLEEMFELNMALEELLESIPETGGGAYVNGPWIQAADMLAKTDSDLQARFAEWDSDHRRETLAEIRGVLNRRKYISNLIAKANVSDRV
ncbi:MAG: Fe-S protein assembly co-chaperone HscB [Bryobacteraceae bacterium]